MTAIKPFTNRRVVAVSAQKYPLNEVCAHPECKAPTADPHHAFPRSAIGGDSWFVVATFESFEDAQAVLGEHPAVTEVPYGVRGTAWVSDPIQHTAGLCRAHHDEAEEHESWIKLENGIWKWFVIVDTPEEEKKRWVEETGEHEDSYPVETWAELGALNPQPGSRVGRAKRKRLQGEERRKRKGISVRVPDDAEDGAFLWDEALLLVKERLIREGLYEEGDLIPNYEALMAALNDWLARA